MYLFKCTSPILKHKQVIEILSWVQPAAPPLMLLSPCTKFALWRLLKSALGRSVFMELRIRGTQNIYELRRRYTTKYHY